MYMQKFGLAVLLSMTGLPPSVGFAAPEKSVLLVLDASGSMKAALPDGTSRMDAAKAAVAQLVSTLAPDTRLAFRAYGHQSALPLKNCKDTALLTPFEAVAKNKSTVIAKALSLQPLGYTPITHALTLAGQDLLQEEAASHVVVLVSDGKETCEADPCAAAKSLAAADAKLVVHTVGAGVDEPTRNQLQCIATAARGSYFDANSTVELATLVGKAAETKAVELTPVQVKPAEIKPVEMPEVKTVAKTAISPKSSSTDQNAPTAIAAGEVVKGRLGETDKTGIYHYWKIQAPAGRYRVVLDIKRSDDRHSNIQTIIDAFRPDSSQLANVLRTNEIDFRTRAAAWLDSTSQPDLVLRVSNDNAIVDYWLGVFPADAEISSPYFVRTPVVQSLDFGKPAAGSLVAKPGAPGEVWYSVPLKAKDYKVVAEFKRLDGKKTNIQTYVDIFGPIGENPEGMPKRICTVNVIDTTAACAAKLVLAQDAEVLFRLAQDDEDGYNTTFTIEPTDD